MIGPALTRTRLSLLVQPVIESSAKQSGQASDALAEKKLQLEIESPIPMLTAACSRVGFKVLVSTQLLLK
jgi:hypothetical protein